MTDVLDNAHARQASDWHCRFLLLFFFPTLLLAKTRSSAVSSLKARRDAAGDDPCFGISTFLVPAPSARALFPKEKDSRSLRLFTNNGGNPSGSSVTFSRTEGPTFDPRMACSCVLRRLSGGCGEVIASFGELVMTEAGRRANHSDCVSAM